MLSFTGNECSYFSLVTYILVKTINQTTKSYCNKQITIKKQ